MNLLVVALLGGLWASILVPGALRARRHSSPILSVDHFERSMGILAPDRYGNRSTQQPYGRHVLVLDDPTGVAAASSRARTVRRRRLVLARLAGAVLISGAAALTLGGVFVVLFVLCLLAAAGYVTMLAQLRAREADTRRTVRPLPLPTPEDDEDEDAAPTLRVVGDSTTVRIRRWGG